MSIKKCVNGSFVNDVYREYGTDTDTITTLPKTIIGDGQNISAYTIKGNMTQASQPTPQNPVYPQETGDKTANLFNPNDSTAQTAGCTYTVSNNAVTQSNTSAYSRTIWKIDNLTVGSKYTISLDYTNNDACSVQIRIMDNDNSGIIAATGTSTDTIGTLTLTFTAATTTHYIRLYSNTLNTSNNYSVVFNNIMLNNGETAMNFEPYGYKIPILSNGNTYPVYLAEPIRKISTYADSVPSTGTASRVIGKYVFTGQESFLADSERNSTIRIFTATQVISYTEDIAISSHFIKKTSAEITQGSDIGFALYNGRQIGFRVSTSLASTPEAFQAWLATQYANGTPVTVWYVLATAQTESFTAPTLPTTGTAESFDVSTSLKPSEVSLTYHGWHEHSDTKYTTP